MKERLKEIRKGIVNDIKDREERPDLYKSKLHYLDGKLEMIDQVLELFEHTPKEDEQVFVDILIGDNE